MTLDDIAIKHGTDKSSKCHNYCVLYEQIFGAMRDEPLKILEIGVATGASIRMWLDFFPNAEIHGIDLTLDHLQEINNERVTYHVGNQTDRDFLDRIGIDFDIIIDDGSHRVEDQIFTFKHLWSNTRLVYVIEDIYTSYLTRYGGGYRRTGTAIEFFKDLVDDVNATRLYNMYKSKGIHLTYTDIGMIQFYPSLICVYKGKSK